MTRNILEEYDNWEMAINIHKSTYFCLGNDKDDLQLENDIKIKRCDEYKYLSVTFGTNGKDSLEMQERTTQSRKIIGALNGIF